MAKVAIFQGGIGTYEVHIKEYWLTPWKPVYDGMFPWRGSKSEAIRLKEKLERKYR